MIDEEAHLGGQEPPLGEDRIDVVAGHRELLEVGVTDNIVITDKPFNVVTMTLSLSINLGASE